MARTSVFKTDRPAGEVSFNVVPLVDVAFLMILFFILTSQMASNETTVLELPKPADSVAQDVSKKAAEDKVIVNIVSAEEGEGLTGDSGKAGQASRYVINGLSIHVGDRDELAEIFKAKRAQAQAAGGRKAWDDFSVIIRGDWRVSYSEVQPVLLAALDAGIPKLNITASMAR